jgi:uncharacterized repeat protein (TIGR03843 family)
LSRELWCELLAAGEIEIEGRMPWSSNVTLLVTVSHEGLKKRAIYKPGAGERRLWDFPEAVYRYEVAAYELSDALGIGAIPETVLRSDAPYGEGSMQRFIEADFEEHYFTLLEDPQHLDQLRVIAGLDLLMNNADRKGGHLLLDDEGNIFAIDNGLSFHPHPKLRTVMWDFAGEDLPEVIVEGAASLLRVVPESLPALLSPTELEALERRARSLLRSKKFPEPDFASRPYPWPQI